MTMRKKLTKIQKLLFEKQDQDYKKFHEKSIPNIDPKSIIGVRVPVLRAMAKDLFKNKDDYKIDDFFKLLPHKYLEENLLHCFLIECIKDFDVCLIQFERFLPFIDNWAVCDTCHPKVFKKHTDEILARAKSWIKSKETYTVRYGINCFMTYFLDEGFNKDHLEIICKIRSEEYYINMMQAWYFATALAKQWDSTVKIIEEKKLSPWVHNKTIQKAKESFRVSEDHKNYLVKLKISN